MPPLDASLQLLRQHLFLGGVASMLFVAGVATALPVVRNDMRWLMAVPLWVFRAVLRAIGPSFPSLRTFLVIFVFNTVAVFGYMVSGVLVVVPAAVAFLTGLNIGVAVLKANEVAPQMAAALSAADSTAEPRDGGLWVGVCSLAVLVLELPCFWLSVGMGIGLGRRLVLDGPYTVARMRLLLEPRVAAYVSLIVPALLVSALAETVAIRGHMRALPGPPSQDAPDGHTTEPHDDT
ncbi:hypothetical protein HQ576_09125 [bacterium]|nr:hypothetical protein [bacterium]